MSRSTTKAGSGLRRPGLAVEAPGVVLLIGIAVSVLAHVALGYVVMNRPIGQLSYTDRYERQPVRIKRATYDLVVTDAGAGPAQADPLETPTPDMATASQDMLIEADTLPPDTQFDPALELRNPEEDLPDAPLDQIAIDMPGFELPAELLATMDRGPENLTYNEAEGFAYETYRYGEGPGGAARSMLAGSAAVVGPTPQAGIRARPTVDIPPPVDPAAELTMSDPLATPPLDFTDLAADPAQRLLESEPLDHDFDYRVTRYDAMDGRDDVDGYFRVDIVTRRSLRKLETMPKDVVFLVDTSSSIPRDWVAKMVEGVGQALRMLNPGDRFNVVLFNEQVSFFDPDRPRAATPENVDAAIAFLRDTRPKGYTDVNAALSGLLKRDIERDRVYDLVLISDGQPTRGVIDTRRLINLITRDNDLNASIYCIGVTRRQNRALLEFLAYRNKGYCLYANREAEVAPTILELMSRIRYPLIKDVRVHVAGVDRGEVYPKDLPNIHQNEQFAIYGRYRRLTTFTMRITGSSGGKPVDFTFTRDLAQAERGDKEIARLWAFWKIHHLYSETLRRGETPELRREIEKLGKRYDLETVY